MRHTTSVLITCFFISTVNMSIAQTVGDYRTKQNGSWHVAASWQTYNGSSWVDAATFPSYASGTITVLSGHSITSSVTDTADQVIINSGGTLNIAGGTFTVANGTGTDVNCNGTLGLSGGTLNGAGAIDFNSGSTFNWTGGTNGGSGILTIGAGANLNMNGGTLVFTDTKTLNNYGTWNWTNGFFNYNGGSPVTNNYSTLNINTDADVNTSNASTGSFNNMATGVINKIGSPGDETSFTGTIAFNNAGVINVNASRMRFYINAVNTGTVTIAFGAQASFTAGTVAFNSGTALAGDGGLTFDGAAATINAGSMAVGALNISSGTLTANSSITMNNGTALNLSGGTLNGTGNIVLNSGSAFNWTGGTNGGSGTTTLNAGTAFGIDGSVTFADTRTVNNYGALDWTSGNLTYNGGSPVLNNYGIFNISTDADVSTSNPSTGSLNNKSTGIVNKIGSPNDATTFFGTLSFANEGTVNINSSTLRFYTGTVNSGTVNIAFAASLNFTGGTATFNPGAALAGDGNLNFDGATATINAGSMAVDEVNIASGTVTVSSSVAFGNGKTLNLSGGTLDGSGNVTFNSGSAFNWTGGTNGGSGIMTVNTGAALNMDGATHNLSDTKTLNNYGTWNWINGLFNFNGGAPVVNNYGTFNIGTDDDVVTSSGSTGAFNNKPSGIVNKTGSLGSETSFNGTLSFSNAGAVNIHSGRLALNVSGTHSGAYSVSFGAELGGTAAMPFTGAAFTNNGSVTLPGLSFTGSAAQSLAGTGNINTLTVVNANGVTLGGTQTINSSFSLTSGKITLGDNDLIMGTSATFSGGNATNYLVTDGRGGLQRRVQNNNTNVLFPVGSGSSYMPAAVQLTAAGTTDNFKVRVKPNIYGSYDSIGSNPVSTPVTANSVNGTWFIAEGTAGGSTATVTVQWNAADEATGFNRAQSRFGQYASGAWSLDAAKAPSGANPYTLSRSGLTAVSFFVVTNQFATTTNNYAAVCSGSTVSVPYNAVGTFNAGNVFTAQLSDSTGNFAAPVNMGSINSTVSGNITASIPGSTFAGTGYKIRIASSSPSLISPPNPGSLPIRSCTASPILTKPCTAPTGLNATNVTANSVQLNWNAVYSANGGYEVQFKKTATTVWNVVNVTTPDLYIDTLQANSSYDVKVRAKCGTAFSDFSNAVAFATPTLLVAGLGGRLPVAKLSIHPNPNRGLFAIQMRFSEPKTGMVNLAIRSINGQVVHVETIPVAGYVLKKNISLHSVYQSGIYAVTLMAGNDVYYGKINYQKE